MDKRSTPYKVQQCSKCPGDEEYYCESCPCNLSLRCKSEPYKTSETTDHYIVPHRKDNEQHPNTRVLCETSEASL